MLVVIEVPASAFLVPVQMVNRWDVKISVVHEPNNLWSAPNPVRKWWPRAVLTALSCRRAPSGHRHFCPQRRSCSQRLRPGGPWARCVVRQGSAASTAVRSPAGEHGVAVPCLPGELPSVVQGPPEPRVLVWKRASLFSCGTVPVDNHPVVQLYTLTVTRSD